MVTIAEIITDFYTIINKKCPKAQKMYGTQSGLDVEHNRGAKLSVNYVDKKDDFKLFIQDMINDDKIYHINEITLIGTSENTEKALEKTEEQLYYYSNDASKYCSDFNQESKYWKCDYDTTEIEDNCGWQFLLDIEYELKDFDILTELKNELNKGDDKMTEDLIARIRIYQASDRPYILDRVLITDETETFTDINHWQERNNSKKASFIIDKLKEYTITEDGDYGDEYYTNINKVEAIGVFKGLTYIIHHTKEDFNDKYLERDGWEICGIDLTHIIMYEFTLDDNTVIRFDFEGMTNNEENEQTVFFANIQDKTGEIKTISKKRTKELLEQIYEEEDSIIELSASPVTDDIVNEYEDKIFPKGKFAYMVEFFSNCVIDEEEEYQGNFGLNTEYIKDAMKVIDDVEHRAEELRDKYADKGVKVTINGFNDGCQYGMAVYVWIPYQ